ncbi:MAG: hypothetical protein IJ650_00430 [Paludibacteraceae bacterium]|nr:hypothetical protein [Paludibacteraceae bacterium]
MKTRLLFAAVAAVFSLSVLAQTPLKPETAPAAPTHESADILAAYCSHYNENNLKFNVLGWGGVTTWQTLQIDGTDILACQDMKWEALTNWDKASYDVSAYEKLHFDVWVPQKSHIMLTIEALGVADGGSGYKHGVDFVVNEGWNTIDADPAWWNYNDGTKDITYDWKDVKYIIFEGYKLADKETVEECTSAEGTAFAFANIYWWKTPAVKLPEPGPVAPKRVEANVVPLFSSKYASTTKNFVPMNWGASWQKAAYADGQEVFFTDNFGWDAFANADWTLVELADDFDMFHVDIYVTLDSKMKVTFEALGAADGGTGWKNGAHQELKANQWNSIDIDLLNAPYQDYTFKDLKVLIFEGFQKPDNSSAEGTAVGVANAYFYRSTDSAVEKVEISNKKANKRIVDGKLEIEVNGVRYNALGAKL